MFIASGLTQQFRIIMESETTRYNIHIFSLLYVLYQDYYVSQNPGLLTGSNELSLERVEGTPAYNRNRSKMTSQIMYMFDCINQHHATYRICFFSMLHCINAMRCMSSVIKVYIYSISHYLTFNIS